MTVARHPSLFMILAPLSVIAALVVTRDVLVTFAIYHVGMCLVVPVLHTTLVYKDTLQEALADFSLRLPRSPRGWWMGAGIGLGMGLSIVLPFLLLGPFVDPGLVQSALARWNIGPEDTGLLFAYMLVFNSGAEELFWRGFVHERLSGWQARGRALVLATAAFASYHLFTIYALTRDPLLSATGLGGVFAGGLIWAWLREQYDSVWPALLGHLGATAGYMTVYAVWLT